VLTVPKPQWICSPTTVKGKTHLCGKPVATQTITESIEQTKDGRGVPKRLGLTDVYDLRTALVGALVSVKRQK